MSSVGMPSLLQSNCVYCTLATIVSVDVTITFSSGGARVFLGLSNDPNTAPTGWEEVIGLVSGVRKTHVFTITGYALFYQILKDPETIVNTTLDSFVQKTKPAFVINNFVVG